MSDTHVHIAIVGSGFAGLGMAMRLRQAGRSDFLVFEREGELGGTWRDNTYPGCACDVQSSLYSFSFAPNPRWSRMYAAQPEILAYLRDCAERYGLEPFLRYGHGVETASWDDARRRWRLETPQGRFSADVLVAGYGPLSEPAIPPLPGLADFEGAAFHSARWDHGFDLEGKRVAVVGTGASAAQFVPAIQPAVAQLHLFQRTPAWVMPRFDRDVSPLEQLLFATVPGAQALVREAIYHYRELYVQGFRDPRTMQLGQMVARAHLAAQVSDPELRAKLTPDYAMGCKRVLLSNDYYPALTRPNVEVVTEGIAAVRPEGLQSADGRLREVDAIIFGTGFKTSEAPFARKVAGRDGRTLAEAWGGSPRAYMGTTVAGFPNLFVLFGPNTGLGHNSVVLMLEAQYAHVLAALKAMASSGAAAIEPRAEAQAAYSAELDRMSEGTVWTAGGCQSWYLDAKGRNSTLWPSSASSFRERAERFRAGDYHFLPAGRG